MNRQLLFWILTTLGVSLEILGDIYLKKWAVENRQIMLYIGFGIYTIGAVFWAFSLKYETLSKAITIFTLLNLIIVALAGIIFFKEDLTLVNKVGILLGILAIICIEI